MKKLLIQNLLLPYLAPNMLLLIIMGLLLLSFNTFIGLLALGITAAVLIYQSLLTEKYIIPRVQNYETKLLEESDLVMANLKNSETLPLCVIDSTGQVTWSNFIFEKLCENRNSSWGQVLKSEHIKKFFSSESNVNSNIDWNNRTYLVSSTSIGGNFSGRLLIWRDITNAIKSREAYLDSKCCAAYISVDNYDEIISDTPAENQSKIEADIDKKIRNWAAGIEASVCCYKKGSYLLFFRYRYLSVLQENNFNILNEMHSVVTGADFPTSISIGIGFQNDKMNELQLCAWQALELALGRGGDQAVIKNLSGDNLYYGGTLAAVAKRNKGRARLIAHALIQQMATADRIFIMGHGNPDMDAFGSAIGLYHLSEVAGKEAYIILNEVNDSILHIYDAAVLTKHYQFLTGKEALPKITNNSLLIVTDCHNRKMTIDGNLVDAARKVVVIDHHRMNEEVIKKSVLNHIEISASSASELVSELLQYSGKTVIDKYCASALLAGITLDTKNFTAESGVRTFEAASWLRRNGADPAEVKEYNKLAFDFIQNKGAIVACAEFKPDGIAVSLLNKPCSAPNVLASLAADELLKVEGVKMSFVACRGIAPNGKPFTQMSARSVAKVDVKRIMERIGGGGHMNAAGGRFMESPEETIGKVLEELRKDNILKDEI